MIGRLCDTLYRHQKLSASSERTLEKEHSETEPKKEQERDAQGELDHLRVRLDTQQRLDSLDGRKKQQKSLKSEPGFTTIPYACGIGERRTAAGAAVGPA